MLSYYLKCRKSTGNKNPKAVNTKNGRIMLLSKCSVCNSQNLLERFRENNLVKSAC